MFYFIWFLIVKQLFRNSSLPNVKVNVFIITLIYVHCFSLFLLSFYVGASSTKIHFVEEAEMKNLLDSGGKKLSKIKKFNFVEV